ncbi:MAG: discoidin domain-containing protein, partial [Lentisphaeria bacterium]|nr:discoidin domain-containing protein [Lentisphaeria bacterium]
MDQAKQIPKFRIPGLGSRKLQVFREARTVQSSGDCFTDRDFNNFDVRIYTTDMRDFGLKTLAEVEKEIEQVHARRKKPGNLAYQRYEGDGLKLSASSNRFMCRNIPESNLWHVTDGITSGPPARSNHGYGGVLVWKDHTPNQVPDWIELQFHHPVKVGRAVVYPALNSLKDYEFQVWQNGQWKTVGSVKNAVGKSQTVTFPQVSSDRFRLWITQNNGPDSALYELELYEK